MTIRIDWLLYGVLYCQSLVGDYKNPWNEKSALYQLWSYNPEMSEQRKRYIHNYLHVDDFPWINPTQNLHEIVWGNPRCIIQVFKFHFCSLRSRIYSINFHQTTHNVSIKKPTKSDEYRSKWSSNDQPQRKPCSIFLNARYHCGCISARMMGIPQL